jgi:septal ring factor EnvC (AmiA/AmiB activator)
MMADLVLPKPIGIPMTDVTKTASPPTTAVQPVQSAPAIPVDQTADRAARAAEKFAWSPDQGKQVSGIMETQRNEYNQKADRVAKNQMTQQTLAEIERVKGQIAAEVEAIRVLGGEISSLNSEISRITSEISSTQSSITSAKSEADRIRNTVVAAKTAPSTAPAQKQSAATSGSAINAAQALSQNPDYQRIMNRVGQVNDAIERIKLAMGSQIYGRTDNLGSQLSDLQKEQSTLSSELTSRFPNGWTPEMILANGVVPV